MYTNSNVKASEYEIGFYNPIYQINIGNKSFFEAKLKYGNTANTQALKKLKNV